MPILPRHSSATMPNADPQRFHFGALTPAMADHLRRRATAGARRETATAEKRDLPRAKDGNVAWLPIKDWQD